MCALEDTSAAMPPWRAIPLKHVLTAAVIFGTAIVLRVIWISVRPFHSDEGVNFHFVQEVLKTGYYPYSHENYHGSSYFYFVTAMVSLFGDSELTLRSVSILSSLILILGLWLFRKTEGLTFVWIAAAFLAVAPSMVFHARYAIHEMLLLCSSMWLAAAAYRWTAEGRNLFLYLALAAAGLAVTTKETCVITFAGIGLGLVCARPPKDLIALVKNSWQPLARGYMLCILIVAAIFSGGFRTVDGIMEFFLAIPQWTGRGVSSDVGHFKPFFYYGNVLMWEAEPHLCIALLALLAWTLGGLISRIYFDAALIFSHLRQPAFRFFAAWFVFSALVYSTINYKTPWLVINLTLPAILLIAHWIAYMIDSGAAKLRRPAAALGCCAFLLSSLYYTAKYNFTVAEDSIPYGPGNPYSYVHTSPGMMQVIDEIQNYWKKSPKAKVLVAVNQYWPLPYYLRAHPELVGYYKPQSLEDAVKQHLIVVADTDVVLDDKIWERRYYRLSDVQETNTYFKREQ